jgi:hypothetical protein
LRRFHRFVQTRFLNLCNLRNLWILFQKMARREPRLPDGMCHSDELRIRHAMVS